MKSKTISIVLDNRELGDMHYMITRAARNSRNSTYMKEWCGDMASIYGAHVKYCITLDIHDIIILRDSINYIYDDNYESSGYYSAGERERRRSRMATDLKDFFNKIIIYDGYFVYKSSRDMEDERVDVRNMRDWSVRRDIRGESVIRNMRDDSFERPF